MTTSEQRREKYEYCALESETMNCIQKRKGYIRKLTTVLLAVTLLFFMSAMDGIPKFIDTTIRAPDNFTIGKNVTSSNNIGEFIHTCVLFSLWMLVFIFANIFHRVSLLAEELCHRKTRYNGSYKKLLIAVFYGSWNKIYVSSSIVLIVIVCIFWDYNIVLSTVITNMRMLTTAVLFMLIWFTLKGWSDTEFEHSASCTPCIGIAMAYGAYYNYYQHVLPELKKRIDDSERAYGINIPVKKLILLFPSSGNVSCQLEDGSGALTCLKDLPDIKKDKGGTLDRKMTNAIYEVSPGNVSPFYCVVEGVNCLSTLKEMALSEDVFQQQAHLLYITLKEILDKSPFRDLYVLLCYDDEDEQESEKLSTRLQIKYEELLNE